ncbi:hypothetical protein IM700_013650 [Paenibacillus sp. DXFW5]|uniref:Uncharacterized protein n=1 Tax=Paenibacillus rhizolycopersici TaxID=2780073 RepID=A0ABS2HAU7_9BACL|nr:hypothetical protein [Paenibacillus rhizolycopersici]MBM6996694.1 hypothetical protein [Paenibacillus rhizolycopersici]
MKTQKRFVALLVILSLVLAFPLVSNAQDVENEDAHFKVQANLNQINETIRSLDEKIEAAKYEDKKQVLKEMKQSLVRTREHLVIAPNDTIGTFDVNKSVWFAHEGDEIFHMNESSHETGHIANLTVELANVTFGSGFDWSGESGSYWTASTPYSVNNLKNSLTFTATGIAISGNLKGASFSGAASGSASISTEDSDTWITTQTWDANSSGSTIRAAFSSSSTMKKYSYSSPDTTLATITFYDPSF